MTDNIPLASAYRLQAVNFGASAKTLFSTMETHLDGTPAKLTALPFYFLISHAAELFLKSALLKRGVTEKEIKAFDYRHSLNKLLEALQKKGVVVTPNTVRLIDQLHTQHQTHILRYDVLLHSAQKVFLPPPPVLFVMLDELLLLTRLSTQGV
jgi:hypothetical protein